MHDPCFFLPEITLLSHETTYSFICPTFIQLMDYSNFAEVKNYRPLPQKQEPRGERKVRKLQMKLRDLNFKVHVRSYGSKMKG